MPSRSLQRYISHLDEARVALHAFLLGGLLLPFDMLSFLIPSWVSSHLPWTVDTLDTFLPRFCLLLLFAASLMGACAALLPLSRYPDYLAIGTRAFGLGVVAALGSAVVMHTVYWRFGCYMILLTTFHWSEYYVTAVSNPVSVNLGSFMLTHSNEYIIAAVASWVEYWLEEWLLPIHWKRFGQLSLAGVALCLVGEVLRKTAMTTAQSNFNHYVQRTKQRGHTLVRHGVYAWFRHPSYVGWFLWSVGTQILLVNPVCSVGFTIASWIFFRERIIEEEEALVSFFGESYVDYQREVGTGLPFIYGYRPE